MVKVFTKIVTPENVETFADVGQLPNITFIVAIDHTAQLSLLRMFLNAIYQKQLLLRKQQIEVLNSCLQSD